MFRPHLAIALVAVSLSFSALSEKVSAGLIGVTYGKDDNQSSDGITWLESKFPSSPDTP